MGQAQGRGIFVVTKLSQVAEWKVDNRFYDPSHFRSVPPSLPPPSSSPNGTDPNGQPGANPDAETEKEKDKTYLIQAYISNPFLVGGKKFDMRVYVLVTSFLPMTVWLYRTGFARFSFSHFNIDPSDAENQFVHLTNVAIQKHSSAYHPSQGCKWDLRELKLYIQSRYGQKTASTLFNNIQQAIMRVLIAGQSVIIAEKRCFELYGFDVLIDDTFKVWILEVNSSPSLTADTAADYHLKYVLLNDMYDVVDVERRRIGVGGNGGSSIPPSRVSTAGASRRGEKNSGSSGSASGGANSALQPPSKSSQSHLPPNTYTFTSSPPNYAPSFQRAVPPYIRTGLKDGQSVGGFDLIYKGNQHIPSPYSSMCPSLLGTENPLDRFPHNLPPRLKKYET